MRITSTRRAWRPCGRSTPTASPLGEDTYTGSDGFARIADRKLAADDIVEFHGIAVTPPT